METTTLVWMLATAVVVFAIAAGTIGREAHRLDAVAPRAVYEIVEATEFVAALLPDNTQARLTEEELRNLLVAHMRWLHAKGLQPQGVIDRRQDIAEVVVMDETTLVAYLLGQAQDMGVEVLDDVDVVHVVEAHLAYFDAIGAVGPTADPGEVPN